jgi:signal transduction histidine kinase
VVFIPSAFFHFTVSFLGNDRKWRAITLLNYATSWCFLVALWATALFVRDVTPKFGLNYFTSPGPLYLAFICFFLVTSYGALGLMWLAWRKAPQGKHRTQLQYFLGYSAVAFTAGACNYLLVYDIRLPGIAETSNYGVLLYAFSIAWIIFRYEFLDIKIAITRTGLLLGTYVVVLGAPFLVGWWGQARLEAWWGRVWWLVPLSFSTILATVGPFAYAFLRRRTEARLLREQRRYQRTLQRAARGMTQVRDVGRLSRLITRVVSRSVRLSQASLFLWDRTQKRYVAQASHGPQRPTRSPREGLELSHPLIRWLSEHRRVLTEQELARHPDPRLSHELASLGAALVVPGWVERELVGLLVLGPKLSGAAYSADDLHAFETLAHEAAIAIENAISYEALATANQRLQAAYQRLISQERLAASAQLAAGLAHEIKNPLAALKTHAEYLPERYDQPVFRKDFLRVVQREVTRIVDLVQRLTDFAKPAPLALKPVGVAELLQDTLALLSSQCLRQRVRVVPVFQEDGCLVTADPQQLQQVALNLLLNSLEAMEAGGELTVRTRVAAGRLLLTIQDTGTGIAPEAQEKIWSPFFTTKSRGTGLGLAIVKEIVDRHGGKIVLTSTVGQGTTVELSLPLAASSV